MNISIPRFADGVKVHQYQYLRWERVARGVKGEEAGEERWRFGLEKGEVMETQERVTKGLVKVDHLYLWKGEIEVKRLMFVRKVEDLTQTMENQKKEGNEGETKMGMADHHQ